MSEEKKDNVRSLVDRRVDRLTTQGNYYGLLEKFEVLRLKFLYNDQLTSQEAIEFVTLIRYFYEHGHSEAMRYSCKQLLDKYVIPNGL